MRPYTLAEPLPRESFGGKAAQLSVAARAGLPVPDGVALRAPLLRQLASGEAGALLAGLLPRLGGAVAVRSSALDEDGETASFAGQHLTVLNVRDEHALREALGAVHASAGAEAARAYRDRLALAQEATIAALVQRQLAPRCAGVLFTRNPMTGADERVIEASWGLGEVVVDGSVEPDRFRMARGGALLEQRLGEKDVEALPQPGGGVARKAVETERSRTPCLDLDDLQALDGLATACERLFGGAQDLEWAFEGQALWLLQRRAATR